MTDFAKIWAEAKAAAEQAAIEQNAKLGNEYNRGFDCGFAWITFPGNTSFGRWAKAQGLASRDYPKGLSIWYSKVHSVNTQSISVHEAACRAARDVLAHALPEGRMIGCSSRLD